MPIQGKSIHEPEDISDGIRIYVMRRIKSDFDFDVWLPALAPSDALLDAYNAKEITWEEHTKEFSREILDSQPKTPFFEMLRSLCSTYTVTLLCHETENEKCHRRLLVNVQALGRQTPVRRKKDSGDHPLWTEGFPLRGQVEARAGVCSRSV